MGDIHDTSDVGKTDAFDVDRKEGTVYPTQPLKPGKTIVGKINSNGVSRHKNGSCATNVESGRNNEDIENFHHVKIHDHLQKRKVTNIGSGGVVRHA